MSPTALLVFRLANHRVRELIKRIQPGPGKETPVKRQDLDDLLAALVDISQRLQGLPPEFLRQAEWLEEVSSYRCSVEHLQYLLAGVQGRLLTEKARLQAARRHLGLAASWAEASQGTL